jgi:hypothetical protein
MLDALYKHISESVAEETIREESMDQEEVVEEATGSCDIKKEEDKDMKDKEDKEEKKESKDIILSIKDGQISVVETIEGQKIVLRDYDSMNESEQEYKEIVLAEGKIPDWEDPDETKMINDLMESDKSKDKKTPENGKE